jgi:hypothetical protein
MIIILMLLKIIKKNANGFDYKEINNYLNRLWITNNNNLYSLYIIYFLVYYIRVLYIFIYNIIFSKYIILYFENNQNICIPKLSYAKIEKELLLNYDKLLYNDYVLVYAYIYGTNLIRKIIITSITEKNAIFGKYKGSDPLNIQNFRWLVNHSKIIKLIDEIWYNDIRNLITINKKIFICNIYKNFTKSCKFYACKNTKSLRNVILLDLKAAFDSVEYEILDKLLYNNLSRKINKKSARDYVDRYMIMIKYRKLYIKNSNILQKFTKGIPTGLISSTLVFTLFMEEIIYNWLYDNNFNNNFTKIFKLNIYVDDIYIKILDNTKTNLIINTLINSLSNAHMSINYNKSKAYYKLNLSQFNKLTYQDKYLGIPFTRNENEYYKIVLQEFNNKYNNSLNWNQIYNILKSRRNKKNKRIINGFMSYKLYPFLIYNDIDQFIKHISLLSLNYH